MKQLLILTLFLSAQLQLTARTAPFLSETEYQWLSNEISGDAAYEHIRFFTRFHRPQGGSPGLMAAARYVEERAKVYGLDDVRLIRQPYDRPPWVSRKGELWLTKPVLQRLASTEQVQIHLADYSRSAQIEEAKIVYVGEGVSAEDYQGREVAGAIVLAYGAKREVMQEAVWERGALGIIGFPDPKAPEYPVNSLSRPDQIHWTRIPLEGSAGQPGTFAFQISARQGVELRNLLHAHSEVTASVDIEAEFGEEPWQVMVEAFIRGTEVNDQDIVLTAHLQEEKFSANDDASGCASMLEIARALSRLIREGRIAQPRRNIRFWWVTEISSQRRYFADHPEAHRSMWVSINQDMVGADQALDLMRVQNVTRLPFSRFHFLNDVTEALVEFVRDGNTASLAVIQAGGSSLYPRPILSRLGSRHRYNARMIPFHNSTDHMTFNEAPIGVPALTFTNWPDNFIHTSDDDLWNIDRTQLQRNAFAVAAIAWTMANAKAAGVAEIVAEIQSRARARLAEDFGLAAHWIREDRALYGRARNQLDEALSRELRLAESLRGIDSDRSVGLWISHLANGFERAANDLREQLVEFYRTQHGGEPVEPELSEAERELAGWRPELAAGPSEFLQGRRGAESAAGLHPLMAFEVLNFIDGRRSGLEIFQAVSAQALRAGVLYYGVVEAAAVRRYLTNLEEGGLVRIERR